MDWISVTDKLPDEGIGVLVYVGMPISPSGECDIGFIGEDGEWVIHIWRGNNVTHWMPLPEPPKGEEI